MAKTPKPTSAANVTSDKALSDGEGSEARPGDTLPAVVLSPDASEPASEANAIAPSELTPLTPSEGAPRTPSARKRGPGRPPSGMTDAQRKAKRNADLKAKRDRQRALQAAESLAGIPAGTSAPQDRAAESGEPGSAAQALEPTLEQKAATLAPMVGLGLDLAARYAPLNIGGGNLKPEERELLGSVWALALAPYVGGESSPFIIAAVTTVQVFALRAMEYQDLQAVAKAKGDAAAQPSTQPLSNTGPAAAPAAAPGAKTGGRTQANVKAPRMIRVPLHSTDD